MRDRKRLLTTRVSVDASGQQTTAHASDPTFSADGCQLAFTTQPTARRADGLVELVDHATIAVTPVP